MNIKMISQVPPNRFKIAKNSVTKFVPPDGSSFAARQFIDDTQKMGLVLVSPGGSGVTTRQFLEKFQKLDSSSDIHIKCNSNPSYITIHSIKIKSINRNSFNLDSLLNLINLLLPPCLLISFFLFYQFRPKKPHLTLSKTLLSCSISGIVPALPKPFLILRFYLLNGALKLGQ